MLVLVPKVAERDPCSATVNARTSTGTSENLPVRDSRTHALFFVEGNAGSLDRQSPALKCCGTPAQPVGCNNVGVTVGRDRHFIHPLELKPDASTNQTGYR
jgi:hypothetical protein